MCVCADHLLDGDVLSGDVPDPARLSHHTQLQADGWASSQSAEARVAAFALAQSA